MTDLQVQPLKASFVIRAKNVSSVRANMRAAEKQNPEHNRQMKIARKIMKKHKGALRALAKL